MGGLSLSSFVEDTQYLLSVDFVQSSLIASALLGILSGVMTSLIVLRQMSFSVHATSELALMGASAALLFGLNLGFGAVAGAIAGHLERARQFKWNAELDARGEALTLAEVNAAIKRWIDPTKANWSWAGDFDKPQAAK